MTDPTTKKTRRTPSELKAYLMEEIKVHEEREKAEAVRLISDAHDTLVCAAALEAAKPHIAALNAAKTHLGAVLAALAPPRGVVAMESPDREAPLVSAAQDHDDYLEECDERARERTRRLRERAPASSERNEDSPCAQALDDLWKHVILRHKPAYGDWEYPGQAYRHVAAEFDALREENAALKSAPPSPSPSARETLERAAEIVERIGAMRDDAARARCALTARHLRFLETWHATPPAAADATAHEEPAPIDLPAALASLSPERVAKSREQLARGEFITLEHLAEEPVAQGQDWADEIVRVASRLPGSLGYNGALAALLRKRLGGCVEFAESVDATDDGALGAEARAALAQLKGKA